MFPFNHLSMLALILIIELSLMFMSFIWLFLVEISTSLVKYYGL